MASAFKDFASVTWAGKDEAVNLKVVIRINKNCCRSSALNRVYLLSPNKKNRQLRVAAYFTFPKTI